MPLDFTNSFNDTFIKDYNIDLNFDSWLEKHGFDLFQNKELKIHISKGSGKTIDLESISTNTLTNPYCQKQHTKKTDTICKNCYSFALLETIRKNMQACLERNSQLLSSTVLPDSLIPYILKIYFRFDSHGELINMTHLINLIKIVEKNKNTTFALWTKRTDLIFSYFKHFPKPNNLILIYSNPKKDHILKKIPKHFDKTFNNVHKDNYIEEQNCTGQQCMKCFTCYKFDTTNVIVEKVKKYG